MTKIFSSPPIDWLDGDIPKSQHFDDTYYAKNNGHAETQYVFIDGNDLPKRWSFATHFTIAELGFGTGLNWLETLHQWQSAEMENNHLSYIAFEQFPLPADSIRRALSPWPELSDIQEQLLHHWPLEKEQIHIPFGEKITLTLILGDVNQTIDFLKGKINAWYLDGFNPAKNPEMWNADLLAKIYHLTAPGGTFATYTTAGWVRRNLLKAGFHVMKRKGFAHKREMMHGIKQVE